MVEFILEAVMGMMAISYLLGCSGLPLAISKAAFIAMYGSRLKYNGFMLPVITCPKCVTFWSVLIYGLCLGVGFVYAMFVAAALSYTSIIITELLNKGLTKALNSINNG